MLRLRSAVYATCETQMSKKLPLYYGDATNANAITPYMPYGDRGFADVFCYFDPVRCLIFRK